MKGRKILGLLLFIGLHGCSKDEPKTQSIDLENIFETVWSDFDRTYSYFEVKEVDWDSVYGINRPKIVNGETTASELIDILSQMTISLRDLHVSFTTGSTTYRYQNNNFIPNSPENAISYLEPGFINNNTLIVGSIANKNVSYVRIKNLSNDGDFQPLESVLIEIDNQDGLILDLRDNGGGNDAIARAFVNKLTQIERVYELVRFRNGPDKNDFGDWREAKIIPDDPIILEKPIIVLINRGVASSAESFVSMLNTLPNTVLVGDTTRGSTGNPKEFNLPNGWSYRVSSWQAATPDLVLIEDNGIAPDFPVINTEDSMSAGVDLILEKALDQI